MPIRESVYFTYANKKSSDMGLLNVSTNAGLYEEDLVGSRSLEEDIDINSTRHLKRIDKQPLEFPVSFYFEDKYDEQKLRDTARWLLQESYEPLIFSNNPERILYAVPIGSYQLIHNGLKQGYLNLTFRCNTYHAYSPAYRSETYDLSANSVNGTDIIFENKGDMDVQPIIIIEKVGDGDISILNKSNAGQEMTLGNLTDLEEITVDCNKHDIETASTMNRYNDFNFNWLNLVYGRNYLNIKGNCRIYFICQFNIY